MTSSRGAGAGLLVYDGDCGFCVAATDWIVPRWQGGASAVAWQKLGDEGLARLGLTRGQVERAVWWVDPDGRLRRGHVAVARAAIVSGGWRSVIGRISLVPPFAWVSGALYEVVARNRHRLPGATKACAR